MRLTNFLVDNITEKDYLLKLKDYGTKANFMAIFVTEKQIFIQMLGDTFDLYYIKTPNQLKVKKNNRPIIFLQKPKQELLRKYKFLSPNQLMQYIARMVTVWKWDKLVRDEQYLQTWLNFPLTNASSFTYNNFFSDKPLKFISNIYFNWQEQQILKKEDIKKIYNFNYMRLRPLYKVKYLMKKYDVKTKKKIKEFLQWTLPMKTVDKVFYIKELELLKQYCEWYNVDMDFWYSEFEKARNSDRIPMKFTWYFKVRKQYEPDNTNMAQLFEDKYQDKMDGIKFDWNDKYLMEHEIKKFIMDDKEKKEPLYEYLAIIENI